MRVLVTGGSGFVGRRLLAALRERGDDVFSAAPSRGDDEHLPLELTDRDNVRAVVELARPELVFHLAAQSFVPASLERPLETYAVNVDGTAYLLEALRVAAPKARLVFASSAQVYGNRPLTDMPLRETLAPSPANPYAASKAAAEALILASHASYGLDAVIGRAFNHIGPGQDPRFAIPAFAQRLARVASGHERVLSVGNIETERDLLDVRDVVAAYVALAERGQSGEIYNVCSGSAVKMREVLRRLVNVAAVAVEIREDPSLLRAAEVPRAVGDPSKLKRTTGWAPRIALADSLREVYAEARDREAALAGPGEAG
ncbi:MAG: GDP-mannose 4,6-dehydratase [Candidatus Eremiobacteraeota bacterium]|nr:GDP-mannose 4,6-dehydratase [Candidatus Eremiobacteraeota bacterium]